MQGPYYRDSTVYKVMQTLPEVAGLYSNIMIVDAIL